MGKVLQALVILSSVLKARHWSVYSGEECDDRVFKKVALPLQLIGDQTGASYGGIKME